MQKFINILMNTGHAIHKYFKETNTITEEPLTDKVLDFDKYFTEQFKKRTQAPQSAYENRRAEISDSDEQIEGVFYIINGLIVPDHYSECLFSEDDSYAMSQRKKSHPRKRAMYTFEFYKNYIREVYPDIARSSSECSLPRGRVQKSCLYSATIYIDTCYFQDEAIINCLMELYRLSGVIEVITHSMYSCPNCFGSDIHTYTIHIDQMKLAMPS